MNHKEYQLEPLDEVGTQVWLNNNTQIYHIVEAVFRQIGGGCTLINATFSAGEEFARAVHRLKADGLIDYAVEIASATSVQSSVRIRPFLCSIFDEVYLTRTHAKFVLLANDRWRVAIITSQNQTRGDRYEVGVVTTDRYVYDYLLNRSIEIIRNDSMSIGKNQNYGSTETQV